MNNYRSLHFLPSHTKKLLPRSLEIDADVIVFDLEDAVPKAEKETARYNLQQFLQQEALRIKQKIFVRCNDEESEFQRDLDLLRSIPFSGVVLPKAENVRVIQDKVFGVRTIRPEAKIIILIESFSALQDLGALSRQGSLLGVGLGLEDMLSELPIPGEETGQLLQHVKADFILKAKAEQLLCFDSVSLEYHDLDALGEQCAQARRLGFDGKFSLHPKQVEIINSEFSLAPELISWAKHIVYLAGTQTEVGYAKHGTELITPPKVRKARAILNQLKDEGTSDAE